MVSTWAALFASAFAAFVGLSAAAVVLEKMQGERSEPWIRIRQSRNTASCAASPR
jgi:hypothetical protein